jgi:hypothetical protein
VPEWSVKYSGIGVGCGSPALLYSSLVRYTIKVESGAHTCEAGTGLDEYVSSGVPEVLPASLLVERAVDKTGIGRG